MFSPRDHDTSDASIKYSSRSGPPSPTSLSGTDHVVPGSRKRKRDEGTMEDLLKDTFSIRAYSAHTSAKSRTLQPLMLLPRSKLPLSFLDIASSAKLHSQARLFEAHVKVLELEDRMGSQPMVLIARHQDTRTLYAVERESRGLCAICQLGAWVDLQRLRDVAVATKPALPTPPQTDPSQVINSKPPANLDTTQYNQKKRLAIEALQSIVKRPPAVTLPVDAQSAKMTVTPVDNHTTEMNATSYPTGDIGLQATSSEIFETVRNQYFEALYLTKASLAYFAKGPLSRARAAFHLDHDSTLDINDLLAFLESLVMSDTLLDKKYRDGVPTCVSLIDIEDHSADECAQGTGKPKKKKTAKKIKPGKNGLYSMEDALIRQWWRAHDVEGDSGSPETTKEERIKTRISKLRMRETQLQIVIILEVLALQPFASPAVYNERNLPLGLPVTEKQQIKERPVKTKKPGQLTMLMDVHIDRLCIWQSVASEVVGASLKEPQNTPADGHGNSTNASRADNLLKDFCVEVIVPFFSSRLPDRCAIINRKLGGPIVISPPKPTISKSASFSGAMSRPGAATKRPIPIKPRRSLQSVLTEDRERRSMSRGPNKAISLMRSATMPVPGLKREASETPSLSNIPAAAPFQTTRSGVRNLVDISRREVDSGKFASDINPKAKKQAMVEAELKEAILALKKPNRKLAGKEMIEVAEKRIMTTSQLRKSKQPVRNPLFQAVQINATPKSQRQKDYLGLSHVGSGTGNPALVEVFPPSSCTAVPQSISRSSQSLMPTKNPLLSSIQATPTRKAVPAFSIREGGPDDYFARCLLASSPLHVRRSSAQLFSSIPDSATKTSDTLLCSPGIEGTPVKRKSVQDIGHGHPTVTVSNNKENELRVGDRVEEGDGGDSIYKALGWDDADDLL